MKRIRIQPAQGFRQRCSEAMVIELDTLGGILRPNKSGIQYPLPVAKYANRPLVQIEAIPRQLQRFVPDGRTNGPSTTTLGNLFICLRKADARGSFLLFNVPLSAFIAPNAAGPQVLRPISFVPTVVDTRNSYVFSTVDTSGPFVLRLTYA